MNLHTVLLVAFVGLLIIAKMAHDVLKRRRASVLISWVVWAVLAALGAALVALNQRLSIPQIVFAMAVTGVVGGTFFTVISQAIITQSPDEPPHA